MITKSGNLTFKTTLLCGNWSERERYCIILRVTVVLARNGLHEVVGAVRVTQNRAEEGPNNRFRDGTKLNVTILMNSAI